MSPPSKPVLNRALRDLIGVEPAEPGPAAFFGLEQEYRLHAGERAVDFRQLIHRLGVSGQRLDPGDANAYRLPTGLALTCDDADAEVASPPQLVGPGFSAELVTWAREGRRQLLSLLPADVVATGFSTHYSASLENALQPAVTDLFARHFAPSMMLLVEPAASYGIYIRPRPGRLEICGDYTAGVPLRAGAVFLAGAVRACEAAARDRTDSLEALPPSVEVNLLPALGRYGRYLGRRTALGFDFYAGKRDCLLPTTAGGATTAQRQLTAAWASARECLRADGGPEETGLVDAIVRGELPLPSESGYSTDDDMGLAAPRPCEAGAVLTAYQRPGYRLDPVIATWDFTVLMVAGARTAYVCLPRGTYARFAALLQAGELDRLIDGYLSADDAPRRLASPADTGVPGLWDEVAPGAQLLPREPDLVTGGYGPESVSALAMRQGKKHAAVVARPLKPTPVRSSTSIPAPAPEGGRPAVPTPPIPPRAESPPPAPELAVPRPGGLGLPVVLLVGAVVTAIAVVGAVLAGVLGGGDAPSAGAPSPSPSASATSRPESTRTPVPSSVAGPAVSMTVAAVQGTATPRPLDPTAPRPTEVAVTVTQPPSSSTPPTAVSPSATVAPAPSATQRPTETPVPTATPSRTPEATPCVVAGAICTPTPPPTPTSTPGGPATQ